MKIQNIAALPVYILRAMEREECVLTYYCSIKAWQKGNCHLFHCALRPQRQTINRCLPSELSWNTALHQVRCAVP